MPKITLSGFDGVYPRVSPTMLGPDQATVADNVKLYAGEIRSWRGPTEEFVPANGGPVYSIYKLYGASGLSTWLTWSGDVDVARGPLADIDEYRVYYTGAGTPRKTNYALATGGAQPYPYQWLEMGVPAPATAPVVGIVAGGAVSAETRSYVYTYVSTFGAIQEESAPSPPSDLIVMAVGDAVAISGFAVAPDTSTHHNITSLRIYRTISGNTTGANFAFVDEIPVTAATGVVVASGTSVNGVTYALSTYVDDRTALQLGEALATTDWIAPPDGLLGICEMANGMLAGFVANQVFFCEPFFPQAWPIKYMLTVPDRVVAIGAFGSTLVVATEKFPYMISGVSPDQMSQERLPLPEPCVSKRSLVSDKNGVTYASPNGLVTIGPGARDVMTTKLFRRDDWQKYQPDTMIGAVYDSKYMGAFNSTAFGQEAMLLSNDDIPAMSYVKTPITAMHVDAKNGYLYYVLATDTKIYRLDAIDAAMQSYKWTSKRFIFPRGMTYSALKVDADYTDGATVTVKLYGDDLVLASTLVVSSFDPVRINPFRSRMLEVEITGTASVRSVLLATSVEELQT